MSNEQEDRWYVQFDSQEVRLMTLDDLDEAFQKGLVHDETYVIPVGGSDWQTLGEILGGDASEDDGAQEAPALMAAEAPAPARIAAPPIVAPAPAPVSARPAPAPAPQLAATSAWPPVSVAPSQPAFSAAAQSMIPVVQDVSSADDVDASGFKPKKSRLVLVAAAGIALLGAAGVGLARLDTPPTGHLKPTTVAAAAVEPPTASRKEATFTSTPTPTPAPAPVAAATPAPSEEKKDESASSSSKLSEDMKKALLAQDEERADKKKKSRGKAAGTRRASSGSKGGSTPFKSSGNVHDPLNDKL